MSAELERIEELYAQLLTAYKEQAEDLRKDKTTLQADKEALVAQLVTKDRQIERFFTSERETKTLFGRLQTFMNNALRSGKPNDNATYVPESDALGSGLEHLQQDHEQR